MEESEVNYIISDDKKSVLIIRQTNDVIEFETSPVIVPTNKPRIINSLHFNRDNPLFQDIRQYDNPSTTIEIFQDQNTNQVQSEPEDLSKNQGNYDPIIGDQISETQCLSKIHKKKRGRPRKDVASIEQFSCDICHEVFKSDNLFQKHLKKHALDKPHHCPKCTATFNVPMNLTLHLATHNVGELMCPACGRKFTRMASFKSHMAVHEIEETLYCTECEEIFHTNEQLEAHQKLHGKNGAPEEPRKCKLCGKQFTQPALYRNHLRDHYKVQTKTIRYTKKGIRHKTNYSCRICSKSFKKPSELSRHLRVHTKEKPFQCKLCDRSFTQQSSVRIHMRQHNNIRPYECSICDATFTQKGNLNAHKNKVHRTLNSDTPVYSCTLCPCKFKKLGVLNSHLSRMHPKSQEDEELDGNNAHLDNAFSDNRSSKRGRAVLKNNREQRSRDEKEKSSETEEESGAKPKSEGFVLTDKTTQTATVTVLDKCSPIPKYVQLKQITIRNVRLFECTYCSKEFKKPSDLIRHIRMHSNEKPFKCSQCPKSFSLKSILKSHEKFHEKMKKMPLNCGICFQQFEEESLLLEHQKSHQKNYKCSKCDKKFMTEFQLNNHTPIHFPRKRKPDPEIETIVPEFLLHPPLHVDETDNNLTVTTVETFRRGKTLPGTGRPHKCPNCSIAFMKRSHLKQHQQIHTGERPYECAHCEKNFRTKTALKSHLRVHGIFKKSLDCYVCDKRFFNKSTLERHMIVHSTTKSFICPYCHKRFKTSTNCRKHIKIHRYEMAKKHLEKQNKSDSGNSVERRGNIGTSLNKVSSQQIPMQSIHASKNANTGHNNQNAVQHCKNTVLDFSYESHGIVSKNEMDCPNHLDQNQTAENSNIMLVDSSDIVVAKTSQMYLNCPDKNIISEEPNDTFMDQNVTNCVNLCINENIKHDDVQHDDINSDSRVESCDSPIIRLIYVDSAGVETTHVLNAGEEILNTFEIDQENNISSSNFNDLNTQDELINQIDDTVENQNENLLNFNNLKTSDEDKSLDSSISNNENEEFRMSDFLISKDPVENKNLQKCSLDAQVFYEITEKQNLQCHLCKIDGFSEEALKDHLSMHKGNKKVQCPYCKLFFIDLRGLNKHIKIHTDNPCYKCPVCDILYSTEIQMRKHLRSHDTPMSTKNTRILGSDIHSLAITCTDEIVKKLNQNGEFREAKEYRHKCKSCSKTFERPSDLKRHMRTHTGERPYECILCEKRFKLKGTLDTHLKTHTDDKKYSCNICAATFVYKPNFEAHIRLHTGDKPFKCPLCDMSFRTARYRKKHLKTHIEANLEHEQAIGNTFDSNDTIENSIQQIPIQDNINIDTHNDSNELITKENDKIYNQIMIDEFYVDETHSKTIQKIPNIHQAESVEQIADNLSQQETWQLENENDNNQSALKDPDYLEKLSILQKQNKQMNVLPEYICEECGVTFHRFSKYKNHRIKRHPDLPFKCDSCQSAFSSKKSLIQHKKTIHVKI